MSDEIETATRHDVLESLDTLVTGAMCVAVGVFASFCLFLVLRWAALRPLSTWRRPEKPDGEDEAGRRRRRILLWYRKRS